MRLTKTVYIKPALLGPGIAGTIEAEVMRKFVGSCSAEHGYITHISNIVILESAAGYSAPDVAVRVSCSVTTYKPYVGERRRCAVTSQIPQGTMMYAAAGRGESIGCRVFVPAAHARNPAGETAGDCGVGSEVEIEILAVKYDKHQFTCIGKYI